MKSGYLYVLVHPSDPNLYKVGQTNQSINPHVVTTRPEFFYLLRTNGYKSEIRDGQRYLKANPWDYLEGWKNGQACGGPITLQSLNVSSQFSVDPRKYYQSANFN